MAAKMETYRIFINNELAKSVGLGLFHTQEKAVELVQDYIKINPSHDVYIENWFYSDTTFLNPDLTETKSWGLTWNTEKRPFSQATA